MKYHEILAEYIDKSEMTLDQIASKLREFGVDIHSTYISKLRLGKRKPPSPSVTVALAKVLNADPAKLLHAEHIDSVNSTKEKFEEALEEAFPNYDKEMLNHKVNEIISSPDVMIETPNGNYIIDVKNNKYDQKVLEIPLLGYIAAGRPVFAEEHINEHMEVPNMWRLKDGETFALRVKGDSMIGSRIHDGDIVIVKMQPEVENGEIAVVNVNGQDATLKRVKRINGQTILYPENPKYDPIFIENENARIIGKVVQVMFDPR